MGNRQASGGNLSYDTVFTVLSNPRRRYVLDYLQEHEGSVELREISEHLAAWENGKSVDTITRQERRRVYTALQQSHLPKMNADGIVAFDSDRGTVEMTDRARELNVYLEVVQGREFSWSEYYLGLAAVCISLVAAAYLGVLPVSDLAVAAVIAVAFALSAGVNVYRQRVNRIDFGPEAPDEPAAAPGVAAGVTDADTASEDAPGTSDLGSDPADATDDAKAE